MGRPAVVKNYKEGKARKRGELQAQIEYDRKKPFDWKSMLTEQIKKIDPLEAAAVLGLTYTVRNMIAGTEEWLTEAKKWGFGITNPLGFRTDWNPFNRINPQLVQIWDTMTGADEPTRQSKEQIENLGVWITSFIIAFIVIRHAGALIGLVGSGLKMVIPFFLGIT